MPLNQVLRKKSHVLWTISLIQDISPDAQTKSEFSQMAQDVIGTETIEKVSLCLASHLQRFRLMIQENISEEEAIDKCTKMENSWQENNPESIQQLKDAKNLTFITWHQFMTWEEYGSTIKSIESFYKENREFRNDVDGRVRQELKNIKDAKLTDLSQQTSLLKQYLFEECAFQRFGCTQRFNYEIYKTPMNKAMRRIKNHSDFVAPGFMVEVHFTQFNPAKKHQTVINHINENEIDASSSSSSTTSNSYAPLFNNIASLRKNDEERPSINSNEKKIGNFIQSAIELLPPSQKENAIRELIKFTTQNIIPLCYEANLNPLRI